MSDTNKVVSINNLDKPETEDTVFYTPEDLVEILHSSKPTVYKMMHRRDFPLIRVGNRLRVYKNAFEQWAMERRD